MASLAVEYKNEMLKQLKQDPLFLLMWAFGAIGIVSIIVQTDPTKLSSVPLIGPAFAWLIGILQTILLASGAILRWVLAGLMGVTFFMMLAGYLRGFDIPKWKQTIALALVGITVFFAITLLPVFLPDLFNVPANSVFSIIGGP